MRLVVALVGLAINFAVPAFGQQKDTVDRRIAQQRDLGGCSFTLRSASSSYRIILSSTFV
jgi:type II secretory pathway pseudopilin PulG